LAGAKVLRYNEIRKSQSKQGGPSLGQKEMRITAVGPFRRRALALIWGPALMFVLVGSVAGAQQGHQAPLELEKRVPLGTVNGRIDHLAVDLARKHLFIAELANNSVGVVDLGKGSVLHRISGLSEPQGVGYVPLVDMLFVANGGEGMV